MTSVVLGVACAQADPIVYTVTTSGANTTNELSEATVEIDDNGVVSSASFADVAFVANSIFRKRGEGFLKSCSGMGTFTGEVRIEEGALIIDDVGQLGPTVERSSTDPLVVVSNGASLVVAFDGNPASDARRNLLRLCGGINIAGKGYQDMGAVRSESTQRLRYLFSSRITLSGDATIVNASKASGSDDKEWGCENNIACDLNLHTLTFSGYNFRNYNLPISNPGHLVVAEDGELQFYNYNRVWSGTEENTFTVKSGGLVDFGGPSYSKLDEPWTLVLEDGARLMSSTSNSRENLTNFYWSGSVLAKGRVLVDNGGNTKGFSLRGPVSGLGGFDIVRGGMELVSADNSFAGTVCATASGSSISSLGLRAGTALPAPFVSTNANLSLFEPIVYMLPKLSFHAESGKTLSVTGGVGGTAASLLKTGPGILALTAPLAVTGGVTLAGGTLRLSSEMSSYSPAPGLIESKMAVASKSEGETFRTAWFNNGAAMNTNRVVSSPELANQHYQDSVFTWVRGGYEFVRYKGYIWNRTAADVTWSVAIAICPQSRLYIDNADTPLIKRSTSDWKSAGLAMADITLSPGPHLFDLRMYSEGYDKPGARGESFTSWPNSFGFVIDFEGRGTADAANYSIPSNNVGSTCGGDGVLFTVDTRTRDDMTGDDYTRASFSTLAAMPGTVLDLNAAGSTFTVQELSGITFVTNGSLHVAKKWTLSNDDIVSGVPLAGSAGISFAPGWTLSMPDLGALTGVPGCITLAVSPNGGLTLPAVFDRGGAPARKWHLELSADGTRLEMVKSGVYLILR